MEQVQPKPVTAVEADQIIQQQKNSIAQKTLDVNNTADKVMEKAEVQANHQDLPANEIFKIQLTKDQKAEKCHELCNIANEIGRITLEKKAALAQFHKEIKELEIEQQSIILSVNEGVDRELDCIKRLCFDTDKVQFLNLEKTEVIGERAMQPEDRQLQLTKQVSGDAFATDIDKRAAGVLKVVEPLDEQIPTGLEPMPEIAAQMKSNTPISDL